ncbi:MAG: endonuclease/exonuclease/phosphatase family protein [Alphaproteobacteria bacterium]
MKILFSNIGYAKGIGGTLLEHLTRLDRHIYTAPIVQKHALAQLKTIIDGENPDLCCFVEIDKGSFHSGYFNQIAPLMDEDYRFHDIADKYGASSLLGRMPLHAGKCNAFLAKTSFPYERLYFTHGNKRLIYRIALPGDITLFFAHFSLQRKVREKQFREINRLLKETAGEIIIMADFNILNGFSELSPLLGGTDLHVLNLETEHTFTFHRSKLVLDLCLCSASLARRATLKVIQQPFSDHAALLLDY